MKLFYQIFSFRLRFNQSVFFDVYPTFLFRSLLGKELRRMSCVFHGRKCDVCGLFEQCVYSRIFETPVSKDNNFLRGRNKASHPFLFFVPDDVSKPVRSIELQLLLLGEYTKLLPYIYDALREAGKIGVLKNRVTYDIESVSCDGKNLLSSDENIGVKFDLKTWRLEKNSGVTNTAFVIEFQTPLRLQVQRQIVRRPTLADILRAALNRTRILTALYGQGCEEFENLCDWKNYEHVVSKAYWQSLSRYSARQKQVVKLGGVLGALEFKGKMSAFDISLLEAAELFHVGKNTAFGLGKLRVVKSKRVSSGKVDKSS